MAENEDRRAKQEAPIAAFTVEFGDDKNSCAFVVGCLARLEVRGAWRRENVPALSLGEQMSQAPEYIPGQQMTIYPRERKAVLSDPLEQDPQLLARINAVMSGGGMMRSMGGGMVAHPKMDLKLEDEDQLKTLILTLIRWTECGNCRVVKGQLPTEEQMNASPGFELYDPANTNQHGHPRYVKDVPAWRSKIEMAGAL